MADRFIILDDGETLITGEWSVDPEQLSQRMIALANSYDNMLPPLAAAREAAIESTALHFETQSDPSGNPWTALDPDYLDSKVADGYPADEILVRTGAGRDAALSEGAWFIAEDALWFDPNRLPHYMDFHQTGTLDAGAQGVISKLRRGESITTQEAGIATSGAGRGQSLPQRQFIGFDETDIAVFEDIFNKWFASEFQQEFPSGGGIVGETGLNMLGEFPVMGRTGRGQPILRTPRGPRFGRL